ncbi:MAG: hypothetical protein GY787_21995 [Alteromonadales bacterium]|nr:hypothetical protein [Alteromonadales bacterium]
MRFLSCFISLLLLLVVLPTTAAVYVLPDHAKGLDLTDYVSFYHSDETRPEKVIKHSANFKRFQDRHFHLKPMKTWYLLKFEGRYNNSLQWYIQTQFPNVPLLKVYTLDENEQWQLIFDDSKRFSERPFAHPLIVLPVTLQNSNKSTLLIEYQALGNVPLSFKLYDDKTIYKDKTSHLVFNSILIAFTLLIFIFSMLQFLIVTNNKSFSLALLAFSISLYISESAGFNFKYIWPDFPEFNQFSPIIIITLLFSSYLYFTTKIFSLHNHYPRLNSFYNSLIVTFIVLLVLNYYVNTLQVIFCLVVLLAPLPIITAFLAFKKKLWAAQFFIVGALFNIVLNNLIAALYAMGLFYSGSIAIIFISKMGLVLELLAFSGALVHQSGIIQKKLDKSELQKIKNAQQLLSVEREKNELILLQQTESNKQQLMQQQSDMLAELVNKKNQLLTDVSHELATPITILKLQVEALKDNLESDVQLSYQAMDHKLLQMERLIADLYQLGQVDIGAFDLKQQKIDVEDLLTVWERSYQHLVTEKGLSWQFNKQFEGNYSVQLDCDRLHQVISNIITNSIKYTYSPGEVIVNCRVELQQLVIEVEDSAPGIKDDELVQIFERLYRCDSSRSRTTGGSGLGLAISKSLVEAHGGSIRALHSKLGGLLLKITLPLS